MALSYEPAAELSPLPKADGSATFSYSGYTVVAAVNGPVEAQRRDENAFEALVDVIVRPAAGVGGTSERQLESILQAALRQLIPVRNFPRTVIQITLQVAETPDNVYVNTKLVQAQLNLPITPALLHAAILGLLTGAIPLKGIATATLLAVPQEKDQKIIVDPTPVQVDAAASVHALAFTSPDELLLAESEGAFTADEWARIMKMGQKVCCQHQQEAGLDTAMDEDGLGSRSMKDFIRSVMETKVAGDLHWK